MYKITVNNKVFKSPFNDIPETPVMALNYNFVINGVITEDEWAKSTQRIAAKFILDITSEKLDCRTKEAKKLPYFTWSFLKPNSKVKIF